MRERNFEKLNCELGVGETKLKCTYNVYLIMGTEKQFCSNEIIGGCLPGCQS